LDVNKHIKREPRASVIRVYYCIRFPGTRHSRFSPCGSPLFGGSAPPDSNSDSPVPIVWAVSQFPETFSR